MPFLKDSLKRFQLAFDRAKPIVWCGIPEIISELAANTHNFVPSSSDRLKRVSMVGEVRGIRINQRVQKGRDQKEGKIMRNELRLNLVTRLGIGFFAIIASYSAISAQGAPPPCVPGPSEDAVMEWNCRAVKYALSTTFAGALRQIRAMAIVQLSVHNAVNGISGKFETYARDRTNVPPENASAAAAAIGAAYQSLYAILTPAQRTQLDVELAASLGLHGIAVSDPGLLYGMREGQHVADLRMSDGSGAAAQCAYQDILNPQPGQWVRILNVETGVIPAAATPCWGAVPTFVLHSADQFPLDDPPALTSERYLQDLWEVKNFGGQNAGTMREEWQSRIADFWDGAPIAITNQVIRQAAAAQNLNLSEKSRAYALVYLAGTDGSIACFYYKYKKLFWRPETAINNSSPLPGGTYWKPYLFPSHPHPEYPSGHSTNSGSMLAEAAFVFGDKPGVVLTPTIIRGGISVTPNWESFSQGINEVVSARVYSGLHFRFTDEASANLGSRIAHFVYTHALRKCTNGNKCK